MTVSGSLMQNIGDPGFNTLDEPIKTTIVIIIFIKYMLCIKIKNYTFQMRDLKAVGMKFKHVLYLKEKNTLLKECKLKTLKKLYTLLTYNMENIIFFRGFMGSFVALYIYGFVSIILSIIQLFPLFKIILKYNFRVLQGSSDSLQFGDGGPEFSEVFVIIWIGSVIITFNSKLLGGTM